MPNSSLRPPAVPLITVDPGFSVWSFNDTLYGGPTRHWTGAEQPLVGVLRVDDESRVFMGRCGSLNILPQTGLHVDATITRYEFTSAAVRLTAEFLTPLLLDDLELASRPASHLMLRAEVLDGRPHTISFNLAVSPKIAVDQPHQEVEVQAVSHPDGFESLRVGTVEQPVLEKHGDDLRMDWGYAHLALPAQPGQCSLGLLQPHPLASSAHDALSTGGPVRATAARAPWLCARITHKANAGEAVTAHFVLAYDDTGAALKIFGKTVPGYWARNGLGFSAMLRETLDQAFAVHARCQAFDSGLNAEALRLGGPDYRDLCALAYRQSIAAHKLVANDRGEAEFYSKECFSNGCMGTVDVSYPSIPLFLRYNPELVKGMLRPVCLYARSEEWIWDFAPHDVGRFPNAFGQAYGRITRDGVTEIQMEKQMPVEECGNMLVMFAAVAKAEGNADFSAEHWDLIGKWAKYLIDFGVDPGEQLCTDDFAGHLAHNANLAVKAIVGVGAYAMLCGMRGLMDEQASAAATASAMAGQWEQLARDPAGHYRLAYDQDGSWSLKYNMLWDQLLGLGLFPKETVARELASYGPRFLRYGIPLDNRRLYTKSDWMLWCATMEATADGFARWIAPIRRMLHESPSRVPFTDWYYTDTGALAAFQNRSVQGGLFAKFLEGWKQPG